MSTLLFLLFVGLVVLNWTLCIVVCEQTSLSLPAVCVVGLLFPILGPLVVYCMASGRPPDTEHHYTRC